eukprot:sb/3465856/
MLTPSDFAKPGPGPTVQLFQYVLGGQWPQEVVDSIWDAYGNPKELRIEVHNMKNNVYGVSLFLEDGIKSVDVAEMMVEMGYAEWREVTSSNDLRGMENSATEYIGSRPHYKIEETDNSNVFISAQSRPPRPKPRRNLYDDDAIIDDNLVARPPSFGGSPPKLFEPTSFGSAQAIGRGRPPTNNRNNCNDQPWTSDLYSVDPDLPPPNFEIKHQHLLDEKRFLDAADITPEEGGEKVKTSPSSSCEVLPDPNHSADDARHSVDGARHSPDNGSDTSLVHISATSSFEMVPSQQADPVPDQTYPVPVGVTSNIDLEGLEEDLSGEEGEEGDKTTVEEKNEEEPSFDPSRLTIKDFTAEIAYQEYQVLFDRY